MRWMSPVLRHFGHIVRFILSGACYVGVTKQCFHGDEIFGRAEELFPQIVASESLNGTGTKSFSLPKVA